MYESVEQKELTEYLSNPDVRHIYLDSSIRQLLALQLRSMREARGWEQGEVGEKAGGMKQSAITRLEDPRYGKMSLSTLKRLAKAFDVAVIVRFAPFNEFISWTTQLNEQLLSPPSFTEEQSQLHTWTSATTRLAEDTNDFDPYSLSLLKHKELEQKAVASITTENTGRELSNVT